MKSLSTTLILLLLLSIPAAVQAQFFYTTNADGVSATITGYSGIGGGVYIPSEINGLTVTSIGDSAFKVLVLPPYSISPSAYITSVSIPETVTNIGAQAFAFCNDLTSVTMTEGLASIGEYAFGSCATLTNVIIPRTVTFLGPGAFASCPKMTKLTVEGGNPFFSSLNGVLFDSAQTTLLEFPNGWAGSYAVPGGYTLPGSYTIPDGVTTIGYNAFYFCDTLTNVTIPASVTNLEDDAFYACPYLAGIYFTGNAPVDAAQAFIPTNPVAYYLPGTTGWTSFSAATGLATTLWNPQIQAVGIGFGGPANQFGFNLSATNGLTVVVATCTDLSNPFWLPLQRVTLTNSPFRFSDPYWTNYPSRFYGLAFP